jgi:hypothetical protein
MRKYSVNSSEDPAAWIAAAGPTFIFAVQGATP